jgi:putative nucleotidyltransferase with HDIG domain
MTDPFVRQLDDIPIPTRPAVLLELEQQLKDQDVNFGAIARTIGRDVALTAAIFKIVNASAFGLGRKIDSIERGIAVLGLTRLFDIVRIVALKAALGGDNPALETFWERSTTIATLASLLAAQLQSVAKVKPEHAYMAGLFHDCGVPLLSQYVPGYGKAVLLADGRMADLVAEDSQFGVSHTEVGGRVAEVWNLPEFVVESIRTHHYAPTSERKALALIALLQLALHLYYQHTNQPDPEWPWLETPVRKLLWLQDDKLDLLCARVLKAFAPATAMPDTGQDET